MMSTDEQKLEQIKKKILLTTIIDMPGSIMLGLGLYAKFAANGNAFHPALNDQSMVDGLLVAGTAIMIWGAVRMFSLSKQKSALVSKLKKRQGLEN